MPSRSATPPGLPRIKTGSPRLPNGKNATMKLNTLANRFDGFEDALILAKDKRKDENEKRFAEVHKMISVLKTSLALEAKNRAISVTAVQSWLADRIEQWTEEVEVPIHKKLAALNNRVSEAMRRLDKCEEEHAIDRKSFPALIDSRANELLNEIRDMRTKMELNIKQREEKEQRITVKLQQQSDRFSETLRAERMMKEQQVLELRTGLETEIDIRTQGIDALKKNLTEETIELRTSLSKERQEREQQHEEVLKAIQHYAAALQDGIKVVGLE